MKTKTLYRSSSNKLIAGVCGGIAEYFDVDPVLIRLIFLVCLFAGFGFVVYLLAWLIIPMDPNCGQGKKPSEEIEEAANEFASKVRENVKDSQMDGAMILGVVILAIGVLLLINNIINIHFWRNFWPILLILFGIIILARNIRKGEK